MQNPVIAELIVYPECFPAQMGDIEKKAAEGDFSHKLSGVQIGGYTARKNWEITDIPEIPQLKPRAAVVWEGTGDREKALSAISAHRQLRFCSECMHLADKVCAGMSTTAMQGENAIIALQSMTPPGGDNN